MKIVNVYKQNMPRVKLIGKRYANEDRDQYGTFADKWQQSFREGWFNILKQCEGIEGVSEDHIGAMRMYRGGFEYWIGALFSPSAKVPEGFSSVEIPAGELGVCWLQGNDKTGELYSMEASDLSMAAIQEQRWKYSEQGWFFERYNNPRFTAADKDGNVILDICAYLV